MSMARERGVFVITLTSEHRRRWNIASMANVLVLRNICDPDFLPLIRKRKDQGKVTIYEISDDLGSIEPWHPLHFLFKEEENQSLAWRLAGYCDALQVPCTRLKDLYGHLNPTCRVFPNQISHVPPERIYRKRNGLVIGLGGPHSQHREVEEIAAPLTAWIMEQPDASLSLTASEPVRRLFQGLPGEKRRFFPLGSVEGYREFLRHIDIGIAPLKDTEFNRSRSDVGYLEYAASGVVPVMKRLEPYRGSVIHGETGFLYTDTQELIETLSLLAGDPILMEGIARSARRYVLENCLEAAHSPERVQFYRDLLLKTSGATDCHHLSEQINGWAAMDGAIVTGRHIRLEPTKFELLLQDGLLAMQETKDRETALRLFRRASAIEPLNYLPYLYLAHISLDTPETLRKAVELNPFSLNARIMLGDTFAQRGNTREALRCFNEAAEVFSDFEIPHSRAASIG